MFGSVIASGIKKIYAEDFDSQLFYVKKICNAVRGIDHQVVFDVQGFFVPNDEYVKSYFPPEVVNREYGIYGDNGYCLWNNTLVLPVTNVAGEIVGLAGYNPFKHLEAQENPELLTNYYTYSMKSVFQKGDYLYCKKGTYKEALKQGYLIITDGVFDTLSLTAAGYLSAALLGSSLTEVVAAQLRFIKKIIVASDNDEAGELLFQRISKVHHGAVCIRQGKGKDVDDVLKSDYREKYMETLDACIAGMPLSCVLRERRLPLE